MAPAGYYLLPCESNGELPVIYEKLQVAIDQVSKDKLLMEEPAILLCSHLIKCHIMFYDLLVLSIAAFLLVLVQPSFRQVGGTNFILVRETRHHM